ncbi:MAG: pyruvate kinase [Phycisphaerales bacterium]|nr:pyruvate kinase [Phycisphaerales bacterium]
MPTLANIVATIGPASDAPETIAKLIEAGVSVFRVNFSHGTLDDHARRVSAIRAAAQAAGQPVAILGDLQGPKIRVGVMPEGVVLESGQDVVFATKVDQRFDPKNACVRLPTDYAGLVHDVSPGQRVLINDGAIRLLAVDLEPGDDRGLLRCRVLVGGLVTSKKGINLPDSKVRTSAITEQDWGHVEWAVAHGLDFLALSFVRTADEVRDLKKALQGMCPIDFNVEKTGAGAMIPVIAKIEKPQALDELDAIVEAADAIMVARGDLGVEMDLAEVPMVQKRLIAKCDEWGKPCIVATQMLESMISSVTPTRAEVSDVANAVLDGADCVMLSAETASGKHPTIVVDTMRRVIEAAERMLVERSVTATPSARLVQSRYRTAALAHGAWHVARDIGAKVVACWSQEGGTARYLSQTGLNIPIIAYSSDPRQVRRMALLRGVTARDMPVPPTGTLAEWNEMVESDLIALGWLQPGDPIVLLAGKPLGVKGATSTLAVHYTGNRSTGFMRL